MSYVCGLDLGQAADYTALVIVRVSAERPPYFDCVELWRFPLQTPYPAVVSEVERLLETGPLRSQCSLVLDATGCGRPVADMFREAHVPRPIAVSIHGGDTLSRDGVHYRVPKRDLVGIVQVLLQERRLRIAQALPEARTLQQELLNFKVKIDPLTAHDSYSAWREGQHDDLVLALALACWWGNYRQGKRAGVIPLHF